MATFRILAVDDDTHLVDGADTYAPEGPLTTFFATRRGSGMIDSWATRVASFRTVGIASIERVAENPPADQGTYAPVSASAQSPTDSAPPAAYAAGVRRSCLSSASAAAMANGNALVA